MIRSVSGFGTGRLRDAISRPHSGLWLAVVASVLVCAIIAWLHFHQRETFQRAAAKVDSMRQSRIDLAQAFLHVTLAGGASSPFAREAGLGLLRQAIDSIERTELAAHPGRESLEAFRRDAATFRNRLLQWSNNPTYAQHTDLLSAFRRLEQEADQMDAHTREQLHALLYQQRIVFVVALSAAALLLSGLCAAVLLAGRGRAASQAQTRRAEQGWREADEALQRSEARFRDTFELAAVGIAHIALDGRFLMVNRKLCDILGYSRKELQTKTSQDVTHTQDVAADLVLGKRAQAGEIESYAGDKRYIRKDGSVLWGNRTATVVRNADGSPDYYLTVIEDIQRRKDMEAALRTNEERLRLALRAADQGLFEVDLRTRKAILSREHLQMLGYDAQQRDAPYEELRGRRHPDDVERLDRMYDEYANGTRISHREELRLANRNGEWIWVLSVGQVAQWDENGKAVRVVGTSSDITERKQTEAALRNSERRFRALIERSSDSICVIDANNRILYLSPSVAAVEGYRPEELLGRNGIENTHPDDLPMLGRIVEQLLASPGTPVPVLWRRRHKDGRWIWLEGYATNLLDDPAVGGIVTNYHDVTERKQTEAALVSERALLRTLIDALPDIVFTKDMAGRYVLCNMASVRHLGFSDEEEVSGKTVFDMFPEELAQMYHADDVRTLAGESILNREEPSMNAAREPRWFLTIKAPLRDPAGKIIGLVGMSRDITERKRAEDLVRRTQKMEALGTLAGGIAHDFNNILLAISGNARLAVADLPSEHPAQESLEEITKAGARAAELVRRILAFSRPQETKRDTLQLSPAVEEALKLLRATLPAMIEIRSSFAADAPPVSADAGQIHQIIMNLTTNAAHAIGDRVGVIEIGVDAMTVNPDLAVLSPDLHQGTYARLSVSDNGAGMDKATIERIFDPFFTTKPAGQGTGLGLSVVHGIMRAYGGAVTVYSHPGKGTTFHCYFPAAQMTTARAPTVLRSATRARGERVLYVDDEAALVQLATRTLERLGYRVTGYHDPAQALQEFQARPDAFDVVITDLSMPGMSGFELAREVLAVRSDIPLLLTSGYVRPQDEETARNMGVRSVILKPNTVEELGHTLDTLFRT